jgi:kinetochore protein NDC80
MVKHLVDLLKRESIIRDCSLTSSGSVRRSSIFPRQSMAPGMAVGFVAKDTRPTRNPQFQEQCRTNVYQYLMDTRCPYPMNAKTLVSPTQKEFQNLVQFLVQILFQGGFTWLKTFEMDCNTLLRDLKYPSHDSCGKTALGAPGTPQNWPHMLAMLNWLVDLCNVSISTGNEVETHI